MCHTSVLAWDQAVLTVEAVRGRRVLEVGARNVNGSLRPYVEGLGPASYIGVDMTPGDGVDEICYAEALVSRFGTGAFDLVLCTEMLEHARNWRDVVRNLKSVLVPGGWLLVTTRSMGFPLHEYPGDYWRFSVNDLDRMFGEFWERTVAADPEAPGAFFWGRKPLTLDPQLAPDLNAISVYSMEAATAPRSQLGDRV
jgi:SAM-dependent methyltransferase